MVNTTERIARGRIVLLGHVDDSRRTHGLPASLSEATQADLDGIPDGLAETEYETYTSWGTNSEHWKDVIKDFADHSTGFRLPRLNATWGNPHFAPSGIFSEELCRAILDGITAELQDRTCLTAFPAESAEEGAQQRGPPDEVETEEQ